MLWSYEKDTATDHDRERSPERSRRSSSHVSLAHPLFAFTPFLIPLDASIVGALIWIVAAIATISAIYRGVVSILIKNREAKSIVLAIVTVCLFLLANYDWNDDFKKTKQDMLSIAQEIKAICDARVICPDSLSGWEVVIPGSLSRRPRRYTRVMYYQLSKDRSEFIVYMRYGVMELRTEGGVNKDIVSSFEADD